LFDGFEWWIDPSLCREEKLQRGLIPSKKRIESFQFKCGGRRAAGLVGKSGFEGRETGQALGGLVHKPAAACGPGVEGLGRGLEVEHSANPAADSETEKR
jgi:hypothetical protein